MKRVKFSLLVHLLAGSRAYALMGVIVLGGVLAYSSVRSLSRSNIRRLAIQDLKARFEQAATMRYIQKIFSNGGACLHTLGGSGASISNGKLINEIKNLAGQTKFEVGKYYGRGTVRLKSIALSGLSGNDVSMDVTLERYNTISKRAYAAIKKSYPLTFRGGQTAITDCGLKRGISSEQLCQTIHNASWEDQKCKLEMLGESTVHCPDPSYGGVTGHIGGIINPDGIVVMRPRFQEKNEVLKGFRADHLHSCCGTRFYPAIGQVCAGKDFQQKTNCGSSRDMTGSGDCSAALNPTVACSSSDCTGISNGFTNIIPNHTSVPSCFCGKESNGVWRWVEVAKSSSCSIRCTNGVERPLFGDYTYGPEDRVDHLTCTCKSRNGFQGTLVEVRYDVDSQGHLIDPAIRFAGCTLTSCPPGRSFNSAICQCNP